MVTSASLDLSFFDRRRAAYRPTCPAPTTRIRCFVTAQSSRYRRAAALVPGSGVPERDRGDSRELRGGADQPDTQHGQLATGDPGPVRVVREAPVQWRLDLVDEHGA